MTSIINVSKLVDKIGDRDHYTYIRVKNLLLGMKGRSTKKDIQEVRKIIKRELTEVDKILAKLEQE